MESYRNTTTKKTNKSRIVTLMLFVCMAITATASKASAALNKKSYRNTTTKKTMKQRFAAFAVCAGAAITATARNASAALNTTSITDAIGSFSDIMPSIGDMVTNVVPTLMTLAIVGFVMRFYSQILEAISSFLKF